MGLIAPNGEFLSKRTYNEGNEASSYNEGEN